MGQSIGRRELERRRVLAAGIVTAAGAEDCAADVFVWPEEREKIGQTLTPDGFDVERSAFWNKPVRGTVLQLVLRRDSWWPIATPPSTLKWRIT